MQKGAIAVASVLTLASVCGALPRPGRAGDATKAFKGEIMDDLCAKSGSHTDMQKMMKKSMGNDAKTCTVECVKLGGKYVLYDSADKTSYLLDPQDKAKDYAGQKVKVTGTSEGGTIHVKSIEPAS
jgi:hypothetical protein